MYTNKAPGGVAYACSFRITEAVYLVERIVDCLADELGMDPAELRMKNLLQPEQFPYTTPTGWEYDSGDYPRALRLAMRDRRLRRTPAEQAAKRAKGELMGIGLSFFTEGVGAGPRKHMDILGLGMADGCELRIHPTGKAQLRLSVQSQGQGHETTFAQIVSHELGIPPEDIEVIDGDTDNTPFGLGTYGSRSTPVSGAAAAVVSQRVRDKAASIAAAALECSPGRSRMGARSLAGQGRPEPGQDDPGDRPVVALATSSCPTGWKAISTPPRSTTRRTSPTRSVPTSASSTSTPAPAQVKVRRFIAVDDCGPRINPTIVEGQIHGGLVDGDRHGADGGDRLRHRRQLPRRLVHGLPAADRDGGARRSSSARPCTPSPHHPLGCKGVGESATVGSPAAVVNAVIDALKPYGVRHADMPLTPAQVWMTIQGRPFRTDLAIP